MDGQKCSVNDKKLTFIFFGIFAVLMALLLYKIHYGFPYEESFHISTALRFLNGDIMLLHEWHGSQMSFVWLEPVVALYLKINGSTEGIALFCRTVFAVFWGVCTLFVYYRARAISGLGALLTGTVLMLFVPTEQMSIYYNTIAPMFLLMACLIIVTAQRWKMVQYTAAGILYAVTVTCCPYLASAIVIFTVCVVIDLIRKNRRYVTIWAGLAAGCVIALTVFVIICLSRAPLSSYLETVPMIFSDREHQTDFLMKPLEYFYDIMLSTIPAAVVVVISLIVTFYVRYRKASDLAMKGLVAQCILMAVLLVSCIVQGRNVNYYMFAPVLTGFYAVICFGDDTDKEIFRFVWIPGLIYSFALHMTTNMGFVTFAAAFLISVAAGLIIISRHIVLVRSKAVLTVLICTLLLFCGMLLDRRIRYVFCEGTDTPMSSYVNHGMAKGIHVSDASYASYEKLSRDLELIKNDTSAERVLVVSTESWTYVELGMKVGTYTTWAQILEPQLLMTYYDMFPDMMPDVIYIDPNYRDVSPYFELMGYGGEDTAEGGIILRRGK
ncbi:hypothetical protein SAMN02910456_01759 [Ruminococcaceae bacterium YRB3002]|nr:hypothetical protein SAMN02910456_01759 [Ruminococcaceae bacterium YRB3002]